MGKAQKVARAAEILADVWEQAEELGLIDQLRVWWGSRSRVKARRKRRMERNE